MDSDEGMSVDMSEEEDAKDCLHLVMVDRGLGHNRGFKVKEGARCARSELIRGSFRSNPS